MGKRYKEFLVDILTKAYQIVLGVAVITTLVTQKLDLRIFIPSIIVVIILIVWAVTIAARLEG